MKTEIRNKNFIKFIIQGAIVIALILSFIVAVNYFVDASQVITSRFHTQMAKIALGGDIVALPENYNERVYQISVIDEMKDMPETVVIGCSRGMFLGEEVIGYKNLYNNCVSGACMEDYYALLGLYEQKYSKLPSRVVIETSPWVFYSGNPEARWVENYVYRTSASRFFKQVNGHELNSNVKKENPYFSLPYFQYNLSIIKEKGASAFEGEPARISTDINEAADYPDGSIRYEAKLENASEDRLKGVKATNGGVTYEDVINMTEMSEDDIQAYENLVNYLLDNGTEVVIYMQPFSLTQCHYIYDENTNPSFEVVEDWICKFADAEGLKVVGGYDSRNYDLTDEYFIDFMHLDKAGTKIEWDTDF